MTGSGSSSPDPEASLLARILEALPTGVVHVSSVGAIERANPQAQKFLGLSWDAVTQRYVNDYEGATFREDGTTCPVEDYPVSRCLMTGQPQPPMTIGVQRPKGDIGWAIFTALPIPEPGSDRTGAVVTFVDITERRRDELRGRAERQLLDAARMIHFDDHPDTTVAVFHQPLEQLMQLTRSPFGFIARIDPDDPVPAELPLLVSVDRDSPLDLRRSLPPVPMDALSERCLRERRPLLETAPGELGGPFRQRVPKRAMLVPIIAGERTLGLIGLADSDDGYDASVLDYLAPLFHACADLLGALGERRARTRLEAQLARAERLASIGTLAAGMAHEVNNPLAYLRLNLEASLRQTQLLSRAVDRFARAAQEHLPPAEAEAVLADLPLAGLAEILRVHARDAMDGAQRVQGIVKDLMTFSRVGEVRQGLVDVNEAIDIALKMADHEIKYRARLVRELGEVPRVLGHDGRLSQVFLNLVLNAARAIEEGNVEENHITVRSWTEDDRVFVSVEDTGAGIAAQDLHRLFEPFFTTRSPGQGAGLGLSVCHAVVSDHGGSIDVESELGQGSRFVVWLPAADAELSEGRAKSAVPPPPAEESRRRRLLLVDDEAMVLRVLDQLLGRRYEVFTAEGLEAAIAVLEAEKDLDLVLCDMMMLDGTGMDLYAWLQEQRPELAEAMVFMTGGTFTPRAREFLATFEQRSLKKPFSLKELDEVLEAAAR